MKPDVVFTAADVERHTDELLRGVLAVPPYEIGNTYTQTLTGLTDDQAESLHSRLEKLAPGCSKIL